VRYDFPNFALVSQPHGSILEGDVCVVRSTAMVSIYTNNIDYLLLFSAQGDDGRSSQLRRVAKFVRKTRTIVTRFGEDGVYAYPPHGKPLTIHNREEVAELLASIADDWAKEE